MTAKSDQYLQDFRHLVSGVEPTPENMANAQTALKSAKAAGATPIELRTALAEPLEEGPFKGQSPLVAVTEQRAGGKTHNYTWENEPAVLANTIIEMGDTFILREVQTAPGRTMSYQQYLAEESSEALKADKKVDSKRGEQRRENNDNLINFTDEISPALLNRAAEDPKKTFDKIHADYLAGRGFTETDLHARGESTPAEKMDLTGDQRLDSEDLRLAAGVLRAYGVNVDKEFGKDGLGDDGEFQMRDLRRLEQVAKDNGIDLKHDVGNGIGR